MSILFKSFLQEEQILSLKSRMRRETKMKTAELLSLYISQDLQTYQNQGIFSDQTAHADWSLSMLEVVWVHPPPHVSSIFTKNEHIL